MKKVLLLFIMVIAFSLTQANNHAVVKTITNQNASLQNSSMNIFGLYVQTTPVFQMAAATDTGILHFIHHAKKTKAKAGKKSKAKKTRHHKSERWGHHHNKKTNKN